MNSGVPTGKEGLSNRSLVLKVYQAPKCCTAAYNTLRQDFTTPEGYHGSNYFILCLKTTDNLPQIFTFTYVIGQCSAHCLTKHSLRRLWCCNGAYMQSTCSYPGAIMHLLKNVTTCWDSVGFARFRAEHTIDTSVMLSCIGS